MKKGKGSKKEKKKSSKKKSKYKLMFNFDEKISGSPEELNPVNHVEDKPQETKISNSNLLDTTQDHSSGIAKNSVKSEKNLDVVSRNDSKESKNKNPQNVLVDISKDTKDIVPKKRFDAIKILSELFFWGGLILVVVGLVMNLKDPIIPAAGLVGMVISIILYAFSLRKHVERNPIKDNKSEIKKEVSKIGPKTEEAKREVDKKLDVNSELNKALADQKSKLEKPVGKAIKIQPKLTDEQKAEKELNKNYFKKSITIITLLFIFATILIVLNKYNLLFTIQGAAVMAIFIAIIIIWILQSKKKTHIQHQTGIMSKPSIDIETKIKNLKEGETEIDLFYEYIKEKKSVLVTTIAHEFGITVDKVEEWAKILEAHNLIMIYYPAFGSPSLKIMEKKQQ